MNIIVKPLNPARWKDFEKLFGPKGACAGCWCMYWRLPKKTWKAGQGAGNKRSMKKFVHENRFAGLLAYINGVPAGWCSLGPRENFPVLEKSRILGRVDEKPVWSIVCFFIDKLYRKQGVSSRLLKEVVKFASNKKITILEGYPVIPNKKNYPDTFAYTGFYNSFIKAGFHEVIRRSPTRPVMRIMTG